MSMTEVVRQDCTDTLCNDLDTIDTYENGFTINEDLVLKGLLASIDTTGLNEEWLNVGKIAKELDIYDRWVYRKLKQLKIHSEERDYMGMQIAMYPPYTIELLREVLYWEKQYRALPLYVTAKDVAENIGKSLVWTQNALANVNAESKNTQKGTLYHKKYVNILRNKLLETPVDNGWVNLRQLTELVGKSREWIVNQLTKNGVEPELRQSSLTGKILPHYPPEAIELLEVQLTRTKPGGDWVTKNHIADNVNKSYKWVRNRLKKFADVAEERIDDNGRVRIHYPPYVLKVIQDEVAAHDSHSLRDDYVDLKVLMHATQHSAGKIHQILEILGIEPELRVSPIGKLARYYPPSTIEKIHDYDSKENDSSSIEQMYISAVFSVGSIAATIRAKKSMINTIESLDTTHENEQLLQLKSELEFLRAALQKERNKMYRIQNKM